MVLRKTLKRILPPILVDQIRRLRMAVDVESPKLLSIPTCEGPENKLKADYYLQDCQIVKERCRDSPGILLLCHGDANPTPKRIRALEKYNYFVISASGSSVDRLAWLPYSRCIGALLHSKDSVNYARTYYPDKIIERADSMWIRTFSTTTQDPANTLRLASYPHTLPQFPSIRTIDVASCWTSIPLKRTELVVEAALLGGFSVYVLSQFFGADDDVVQRVNRVIERYKAKMEQVYLPFEPYAIHKIGERIFIDGRPIGINSGVFPSVLDRARVYLHTSEKEGFPSSIIEALMRNVPVVVCSDMKGPLLELSDELNPAITVSAPTPQAIDEVIKKIIMNYEDYGSVREKFRTCFDPFEVNRRFVRCCQEFYLRKKIPWKGHCQGLMGGTPAKFNIADDIPGLEQSTGQQSMFPSPHRALRYLDYQIAMARSAKNTSALGILENERKLVMKKI